MNRHSMPFDDALWASSFRRPPHIAAPTAALDTDLPHIGYEAADPSLQTPLWCEEVAATRPSGGLS